MNNEARLKSVAGICFWATILVTLIGGFFVAFLGGPAAAVMAICMVLAVAATSSVAGAAVALLGWARAVKTTFHE